MGGTLLKSQPDHQRNYRGHRRYEQGDMYGLFPGFCHGGTMPSERPGAHSEPILQNREGRQLFRPRIIGPGACTSSHRTATHRARSARHCAAVTRPFCVSGTTRATGSTRRLRMATPTGGVGECWLAIGYAVRGHTGLGSHGRSGSGLLAVLLDTRGSQPRQAVLINGTLPGEEFFDCQSVPGTGLLERKQAAAHSGDYLRLAADYPSLGAWGRQIRNR
jgi:hypothetical protein